MNWLCKEATDFRRVSAFPGKCVGKFSINPGSSFPGRLRERSSGWGARTTDYACLFPYKEEEDLH
ncbi:hypothetical protein DPMN_054755 [Dreissena polymorpha]|uniref:Uncharacterized protein n=1 Tax=Dreissena polymorpha TaxID=45954 RepID=A0A9D4CNP1_DREPO|nr:hypothetical protein DPMN_054755 [Dreissena polymorpha]